ncbi:MAG: hypothetical protein ACKVVP_08955 [Chloroflexota bacterium]
MINDILSVECQTFARYLIGQTPSDYVMDKYRQAHLLSPELRDPVDPLDAFMLQVVCSWRPAIGPIDSYTSFFRRQSMVRKKMILLLSILESSDPSFRYFDSPDRGGKLKLCGLFIYHGFASITGLIAATGLLMPAFWIYKGACTVKRLTCKVLPRGQVPDKVKVLPEAVSDPPLATELPVSSEHPLGRAS